MNKIIVFGNQTKKVNFFPARDNKKALAIFNVAENSNVKEADGKEARMTVFYTVKAWDEVAEKLAEEDKLSEKHNKFYKITGRLVTTKSIGKDGKEYINKTIHADKVELIFTPGVDTPKKEAVAA